MTIKNQLLSVLLIFLTANFLYSQINLLDKRVSIEFKDKKVSDAINLLNKKTGNILSYKNDILPNKKKISFNAKNETIKNILEKILKETDIRFFQVGDQIILKRNSPNRSGDKPENNGRTENTVIDNIRINNYSELSVLHPASKSIEITMTGKIDGAPIQYSMKETPECPFCDKTRNEPDYSEISTQKRRGKHSLLFSPGFKTNSRTSVVSSTGKVSINSGVTATISYGYMFTKTWQVNILTGAFVADAAVSDTVVSAKVIIPLLFGFRHYPDFLALSESCNLYVGGSIGAYIGVGSVVSTTSDAGSVSEAETKLGISLNLGMDIYPFRWCKIGPNISFHLFGDYNKIIQESSNFSGPEFSLNMGLVF